MYFEKNSNLSQKIEIIENSAICWNVKFLAFILQVFTKRLLENTKNIDKPVNTKILASEAKFSASARSTYSITAISNSWHMLLSEKGKNEKKPRQTHSKTYFS